MNTDLSIIALVLEASPTVQLVMVVLLLASVASWYMIGSKRSSLKRARREAVRFEDEFWSGTELNGLYNRLTSDKRPPAGMASLFTAGFKEFARLRQGAPSDPAAVLDGTQRVMRVALSREIEELETHLSFLATVGSTSPYIGLFGTVWGIMNSFRGLGNVHQATLAMVAPGISEALVATAMGLFAAIPAVIAYNQYSSQVERLINRYDTFLEEFSSILHRQNPAR